MRRPPISVVMPAKNAESTIRLAVSSTLLAMSPFDELVIVNDGSEDGTSTQVSQFSDSRINLVELEKSVGIASALNFGVRKSRHGVVARMDSDDICLPWRFDLQSKHMAKRDADFVFTNCLFFLERWPAIFIPNAMTSASSPQLASLMLRTNPFIHPTAMFSKSVFEGLGGYRNVPNEDYDLWQRGLLEGKSFRRLGVPTILFRLHARQITKSGSWVSWMEQDSTKPDASALAELAQGAKLNLVMRYIEIPKLWPRRRSGA